MKPETVDSKASDEKSSKCRGEKKAKKKSGSQLAVTRRADLAAAGRG